MSDTSPAPPSSSSPATLSLCISDVFPISSLTIYLLPQWLCIITLVSLVFYSYVVARMKSLDLERLVLFSEEVGSVKEL